MQRAQHRRRNAARWERRAAVECSALLSGAAHLLVWEEDARRRRAAAPGLKRDEKAAQEFERVRHLILALRIARDRVEACGGELHLRGHISRHNADWERCTRTTARLAASLVPRSVVYTRRTGAADQFGCMRRAVSSALTQTRVSVLCGACPRAAHLQQQVAVRDGRLRCGLHAGDGRVVVGGERLHGPRLPSRMLCSKWLRDHWARRTRRVTGRRGVRVSACTPDGLPCSAC